MKQGWEIKKLGEVCDFQGGSQPPKSNFIFEPKKGYVRFLQIRDFGADKNITYIPEAKKNRYCNEDDILLGRYGASVGKVLVNKSGAYNVAVMKTIPSEDLLYKRYLFFYLTSNDFQGRLSKVASRSAQDGFSKDDIYDFPILLPPLPEQQRIVAILDEAFAAIAKAKTNAEQNLKNAKELFESYLQGVFENKGEGWEEVKLSELAKDITDGDHMPPPKTEEGYPFITISNINKQNHQIDFSDTFKVSKEYFQKLKENRKPKNGDVLYTVTGSYGIPVLIEDDFEFCFQRHIGLIRPKENVSSKWLYYWILSPQAFFQANDTATGTAQKTVSLTALRNFKLPKISLKAQQIIVQKLDALSAETKKLEAIYQQKLNDIAELKKSVLQKAFNGELKTSKVLVV
jgi:type I restriction enzyme, S subunit